MTDLHLHRVAQLSTSIEEIDAVTLSGCRMFVMEVAKKSRERYPLKTVYFFFF